MALPKMSGNSMGPKALFILVTCSPIQMLKGRGTTYVLEPAIAFQHINYTTGTTHSEITNRVRFIGRKGN